MNAYCPTGLFVTEVTGRSAVLHWDSTGPMRGRGKLVECEVLQLIADLLYMQ